MIHIFQETTKGLLLLISGLCSIFLSIPLDSVNKVASLFASCFGTLASIVAIIYYIIMLRRKNITSHKTTKK